MTNLASFLAEEYWHDSSVERIASMDKMLENPRIKTIGSPEVALLVYFCTSDDGIALLRGCKRRADITKEIIRAAMDMPGSNMYFIIAKSAGNASLATLCRSEMDKHGYTSVSWSDPKRDGVFRYYTVKDFKGE